jgi:ATPase family associated with various cellular activities (AAA)/AAA lid domain
VTATPPTTEPRLTDALALLERTARAAGLDPAGARAEGEALAAAIAESASGAHADWGIETGHRETQAFFDAASRGRRFRAGATTLLARMLAEGSAHASAYADALVGVCASARGLGRPDSRIAGNAALAAAAQRSALRPASAVPPPFSAAPPAERRGAGSSLDLDQLEPGGPGAFPGFGFGPTLPGPASPPPEAAAPSTPHDAPEPVATTAAVEPKSLDELLAQLDALTGLAEVKAEIHRQVALLRVERLRTEAGLKAPTITRHLVFVGNPGTGKTTVARLVGGIYRALGLLSKGQLVEVDRSELVAGFLGQTAIKTAEAVASAVGGVLFIDEAYSLAGDQYGTEAVDTLVKEMEDRRDDLVVIVAGYPGPMAIFVAQNPGLASRFRTTIEFADYSDDELDGIFAGLAEAADYDVSADCRTRFRAILAATPRGPSFGNGRFARNVLEAAIGRHAWRLREVDHPSLQELRELSPDDLEEEPAAATAEPEPTTDTDSAP